MQLSDVVDDYGKRRKGGFLKRDLKVFGGQKIFLSANETSLSFSSFVVPAPGIGVCKKTF
jgi:hypothetical protein